MSRTPHTAAQAVERETRRARRGGELEILREDEVLSLPRGDGREAMRVVSVRARASGRDLSWTSVGVYWRADDGTWRRGKNVATVRDAELRPVVDALLKLAAGTSRRDPMTPTRGTAPSAGREPQDDSDLDRMFGPESRRSTR